MCEWSKCRLETQAAARAVLARVVYLDYLQRLNVASSMDRRALSGRMTLPAAFPFIIPHQHCSSRHKYLILLPWPSTGDFSGDFGDAALVTRDEFLVTCGVCSGDLSPSPTSDTDGPTSDDTTTDPAGDQTSGALTQIPFATGYVTASYAALVAILTVSRSIW